MEKPKYKLLDPKSVVSIGNHLKEPDFFYVAFQNCYGEEFLFESSHN